MGGVRSIRSETYQYIFTDISNGDLVLHVLLRGQISERAEQMGPCLNPWAPGTLLETVLPSSGVNERTTCPCV